MIGRDRDMDEKDGREGMPQVGRESDMNGKRCHREGTQQRYGREGMPQEWDSTEIRTGRDATGIGGNRDTDREGCLSDGRQQGYGREGMPQGWDAT